MTGGWWYVLSLFEFYFRMVAYAFLIYHEKNQKLESCVDVAYVTFYVTRSPKCYYEISFDAFEAKMEEIFHFFKKSPTRSMMKIYTDLIT